MTRGPRPEMGRGLTTEESREMAAKRWSAGPRKPPVMTELRADLLRGLPLFRVVETLNQAVQEGQPWAVALWMAYVCGRPTNQSEITLKGAPSARRLTDQELLEILADHGVAQLPGAATEQAAG